MASPQTRPDESVPTYDGSYYLIVSRVIDAVRSEKGVKNKLSGATRQLKALAGHTKARFSALSLLKKLGVAILLMTLGAGAAVGIYALRTGRDADGLRADIKALLSQGDLAAAQKKLTSLRALLGDLGARDKSDLDVPLRNRLAAAIAAKKKEIASHKRAGRFDDALKCMGDLEALDVDASYVVFSRAEILRAAERHADARQAYAEYVRLFPNHGLTDDALFWQALASKNDNDPVEARRLLVELIDKYPRSNFLASGKRLLAELDAPPATQ